VLSPGLWIEIAIECLGWQPVTILLRAAIIFSV
jgi:hypothetical protein